MDTTQIDRALKVSRILHLALLGSIGVYVAIAAQLTSAHDPTTPVPLPELAEAPFSHWLFIALASTAVVAMAATPLVRMKLMPPRSQDGNAPHDVAKALAKLRAAEIVTWAMCESVAIYGLILTFLSYDLRYTLAFGAVGALAMLAYAPSRRVYDDVARAAGG